MDGIVVLMDLLTKMIAPENWMYIGQLSALVGLPALSIDGVVDPAIGTAQACYNAE